MGKQQSWSTEFSLSRSRVKNATLDRKSRNKIHQNPYQIFEETLLNRKSVFFVFHDFEETLHDYFNTNACQILSLPAPPRRPKKPSQPSRMRRRASSARAGNASLKNSLLWAESVEKLGHGCDALDQYIYHRLSISSISL